MKDFNLIELVRQSWKDQQEGISVQEDLYELQIRNRVSRIKADVRGSMFMWLLGMGAVSCLLLVGAAIVVSGKEHMIHDQRMVIEELKVCQDSVMFNCVHCGYENCLGLK